MLLLLFRRLRPHHHHHLHLRRHHCRIPILPFSSSPESHSPPSSPTPTSLSARMSFVFDQIDAIEKERSEKDQTLQRIRAWRESKKQQSQSSYVPPVSTTVSSSVAPVSPEVKVDPDPDPEEAVNECNNLGLLLNGDKRKVEIVHPWPEWIEWMERLLQQNYFDHKRKDEDGMMENLGFNLSEIEAEEDGFDFARDFKTVQTAVLNFGKDRFDILRSLSRQDLQILVGYGCPSADKKVVFSSKLLRKLVHLDEGDVCSSCSLRSSCERAYLVTNKEDEARTIDVVRVLLTYGFDTVNGSVTNKPLLKMKNLKTVIRRLLHEVVKLSAVPIDPNLPPPVIKKPPPKVKQPPPTPKRRVGRDDIEMKKGDWLCPKCDFMNFAKNSICLQCDAKRPKRQLLPGEWECPQCNFLNYRRNMVCFHCEHKRPPDETMESQVQERQRGPRRPEKVPDRREFSNAWNFDFDDNESDGADIAAFENADSQRMNEDFSQNRGRGHVDGYHKGNRETGLHEKDSDVAPSNPGIGFNDFDDEDDDLDSYELETPSGGQKPPPRVNFSELEVDSMSEDEETTDRRESNCHAQNRPSRSSRQKVPSSEDEVEFGSDDDLPVHPNWKSSHITQFDQRSKRRGGMSFGSDDELSSDPDDIEHDFGSRKKKGNNRSSSRGGNSDFEDGSLSDVEPRNNTRFGSKNRLGNRNGQRSFTRGGSFDFEDSDVESNSSSSRFGRGGFGNKGNKHRSFQRGGSSDFEDSDLESNSRSRFGRGGFGNKGNTHGSFRRRGNSDSEDDFESNNTSRFGRGGFRNRGNSRFDSKRNSSKESLGRSSRGSHGKMSDDDFGGFKKNGRNDDFRNSRSSRAGTYKERSDNQRGDSYLDDDRFRRPRVNVR